MMDRNTKLKLGFSVFAGVGAFIFAGFFMLPDFIESPLNRYLTAFGISICFAGFIYLNNMGGGGGDGGGFSSGDGGDGGGGGD